MGLTCSPLGLALLGEHYATGIGVGKNLFLALDLLRQSAKLDNPLGQHQLGILYMSKDLGYQDDDEASKWQLAAARQGHASAQFEVGWHCSVGRGVPKEEAEAVKWIRRSAEGGYPKGQFEYGWLLQNELLPVLRTPS